MQVVRQAPDPLYLQVRDALRADIYGGRYQPHQQLPSERALCQQFKVSRMTVRQALLDLARAGHIYTRVGKGTFVAPVKIEQSLQTVTGFSQEMAARQAAPASRVIVAATIAAPAAVAAALGLAADDTVI